MFGVEDVEVEEVWDMETLCFSNQIYGLIFLFKYEPKSREHVPWDSVPDVFFAQQVIPNACATQAILSVLMNCKVNLGQELTNIKEFCRDFNPTVSLN